MLKTACHEWHVANNGRMVDFAGWQMPIQYSSIVEEHNTVRNAVGLFDVGHMGRLIFTGDQACSFLDRIVTNNVEAMSVGQIRYALVTNENGFILDDVLVYRFENFYMMVVNASNREKIVSWIEIQKAGYDFQYKDLTIDRFMLAVQGPKSVELLQPLVKANLSELKYYHCQETSCEETTCGEAPIWLSRTGYTGEDGFEIIVDADKAAALWQTLMTKGSAFGVQAAGLGCRDTLRLEAAMPLYGHELNEQIDPLTAGLKFGVKLKKPTPVIGIEALKTFDAQTDRRVRIGLEIEGRRIAREETTIFDRAEEGGAEEGRAAIGTITSGTFSPTLQKVIAMGYVSKENSAIGTELFVDLRGKLIPAKVVKLPFYKRS